MLTLIALFFTAATVPVPVEEQSPAPITISAPISSSDGSVIGGRAHALIGPTPTIWYVTSGQSLCLARSAQLDRPTDAGFGWSLELTQTSTSNESVSIVAKWQRLWENGHAIQLAAQRTALLSLRPGASVTLDSLVSPDTFTSVSQTAPTSKCNALSMSLQIGMEPSPATAVISAEFWLVHTDATGLETSQRQVVRSKGQNAEYFFDPETVTMPNGPAKTSVSGELSALSYKDGRLKGALKIARQTPEGGSGSAVYPISVAPGEVLSFPLGAGPFPSDRFKVMLRLSVLAREQ